MTLKQIGRRHFPKRRKPSHSGFRAVFVACDDHKRLANAAKIVSKQAGYRVSVARLVSAILTEAKIG